MKSSVLIPALFISLSLYGQREDNPYSQDLKWRNIGPANMMGRIAAVDALNSDHRHVVVGSASGGVFKSTNGGHSWRAIFDRYGVGSIGSVSIDQSNPQVIWVGTGESANRNSSGWGDGIYRSVDGGESFRNMGLKETHHIAEIALHPQDQKVAYAAAVGHLWGYEGSRGLFKTTDAGATWDKLTNGLPDDDKTGCTEVIMDPRDPDVLFAGFYHRLRTPYWYTSGGEQGGLFKSQDGGKSWRRITAGLPEGHTGMIDISVCLSQPDVMVAAIEADENLPEGQPGSGVYLSSDGGESWTFLHKHAVRPFYHGQIEIDPQNPDIIYVVSRDFQISYNGGKTFERRTWATDGGDDHDMWIAPYDSRIMYLCTDQGLRLSLDGGENILSFNNMAIGQYYAIGVDMRDPYYVIGGLQDNSIWIGPSNSREYRGILNRHNLWLGEGDGFHSQVDPTDWRTAYIVNHVGFAAKVDRETREHAYITPNPENISNFKDFFDQNYPETSIDYTIDPGEYWFFYEYHDKPQLPPQFRFNWSSPLILSPHDPKTVYFAGNHLFQSKDKGETWTIISPDLTKNDPEKRNPSKSGYLTRSVTGGENHFTIVSIAESKLRKGLLWAGCDDGSLWISRDNGKNWEEVGKNISGQENSIWVSRVEPSSHKEGRCYITLDNHRYDDMKPYTYVTEDYGKTWSSISSNLNQDYSLYVIREDPVNENLLFVGSEEGVNFSLDRGKNWYELMAGLPTVAIHDLVIHPRDGDLVAGTHGRSIWILDDLTPLRSISSVDPESRISYIPSREATDWYYFYEGRTQPAFEFRGQNPKAGASIHYWLSEAPDDTVMISVLDKENGYQRVFRSIPKEGLNRTYWDLNFPVGKDSLVSYRNRLDEVLKELSKVVKGKVYMDSLKAIRKEFKALKPEQNALNHFRRRMVMNFSGFSDGKPYFPKKLFDIHATPGQYDILLRYGEAEVTGAVSIRKDPNL